MNIDRAAIVFESETFESRPLSRKNRDIVFGFDPDIFRRLPAAWPAARLWRRRAGAFDALGAGVALVSL